MANTPVWGTTRLGNFSVKSATWIAHNLEPNAVKWPHRWIWKLDIPPKLQIFLWQIMHNSVGVRDTLYKKKIIPFNHCSFCCTYPESHDHLFLTGDRAKEIWNHVLTQSWLPGALPPIDLITTLSTLRKNTSLRKFIILLWSIWKERNSIIFKNETFDIPRTFHRAQFAFKEWNYCIFIDTSLSLGSPMQRSQTHSTTHN
ncbi:uncharacterized protein LOC110709552 [Chenopodium quinoa]|uniref:uncharacterized protein LOC110709552 n=1 Tax=Chenopodium quinoa TaxID=63459 RepID=UPI000B76BAEF|nr:uncharacterized protein LOC110709552 [Chenopodium quinoa]